MVAIGWYVVEKYARQREKRSDLRSAVLSFADAVGEVREAAFVFYRLHGNDPQATRLAATIRSKVSSLSDQLAIMKAAGLEIESDELLKRFRQSVTGGEFDSSARQPLAENSSAFLKMNADAESLSREVHIAMLRVLLGEGEEAKASEASTERVLRVPLSQPQQPE